MNACQSPRCCFCCSPRWCCFCGSTSSSIVNSCCLLATCCSGAERIGCGITGRVVDVSAAPGKVVEVVGNGGAGWDGVAAVDLCARLERGAWLSGDSATRDVASRPCCWCLFDLCSDLDRCYDRVMSSANKFIIPWYTQSPLFSSLYLIAFAAIKKHPVVYTIISFTFTLNSLVKQLS